MMAIRDTSYSFRCELVIRQPSSRHCGVCGDLEADME